MAVVRVVALMLNIRNQSDLKTKQTKYSQTYLDHHWRSSKSQNQIRVHRGSNRAVPKINHHQHHHQRTKINQVSITNTLLVIAKRVRNRVKAADLVGVKKLRKIRLKIANVLVRKRKNHQSELLHQVQVVQLLMFKISKIQVSPYRLRMIMQKHRTHPSLKHQFQRRQKRAVRRRIMKRIEKKMTVRNQQNHRKKKLKPLQLRRKKNCTINLKIDKSLK